MLMLATVGGKGCDLICIFGHEGCELFRMYGRSLYWYLHEQDDFKWKEISECQNEIKTEPPIVGLEIPAERA